LKGVIVNSFFDEIAAVVAQLPEVNAFRKTGWHEEGQSFVNAYVVYEASHMKLRFVKDRGEIRTEVIAPQGADWWTLDQLCELLGKPMPEFDLQSNAKVLLRNYSEIGDALAAVALPRTTEAIKALTRKKHDEMLARFGKR
jgi:hypothetical protein